MKNKWWIILIFLLVLAICFFAFFFLNKNTKNNTNGNNSYSANRTSSDEKSNKDNDNVSQNDAGSENSSHSDNKKNINADNSSSNNINSENQSLISSFSTKIYSTDSNRQNNMKLTCNQLNGTVVPNNSTFSFCNTVGQSTPEKGYKEADIFDEDGNKKKGIGGGKCQISTTLYNAVLSVPNLIVVERHEHSNKVPYIQDGKDAAVNYGVYDLKFENRTGNDIKVLAETTDTSVNISIYKIL